MNHDHCRDFSCVKLWLIYSFIALLSACGSQDSVNTGLTDKNTALEATKNIADNAESINKNSDSILLASLAQLYPNGQLPKQRSDQAAQELSQNPTALLLTSAAPSATSSILQQKNGATFQPQAVAADYQPVQRIQNTTLYGAYFFSIYPSEIATALATNPNWASEGPAFWASLATGADLYPVHRFRNKTNGSYLYSIYETERSDIATNYAATFEYEGVAWYARQTSASGWSALYRFRNKTNGTYLFSAYESEKDAIVANYPDVFALEGIAYYVRQDAPLDTVVPPVVPPVVTPTITSITPNSPTTVELGVATTFYVLGTNLPLTARLTIADAACQVASNSTTSFTQTCTLGGAPGLKVITVYSASGGIVIDATRTITAVSPPSKLPDTGITSSQCYKAGSNVLSSCAYSLFAGTAYDLNFYQDGMLGFDKTAPAASDGKLGFSYSEVPNPLGGNFPRTDCIKDNITGLTWEGKTTSGVRSSARTYTSLGNKIVTDTAGYEANANTGLCGFDDWRLPTAAELQSIVDYGAAATDPKIDAAWFPNTISNEYWTSSSRVGLTNLAWIVSFATGGVFEANRDDLHSVRLVRGTMDANQYSVSANGQEVTDSKTGLIWRRCSEGQTWNGNVCTGSASIYNHEAALTHATAQALAASQAWRLPNVKELASIADNTVELPAINSAIFPATPLGSFWSSSPYVSSPSETWGVSFQDSYVFSISRINPLFMRLVRNSP